MPYPGSPTSVVIVGRRCADAPRAPSSSVRSSSSRPTSGATPIRVVVFSAASAARDSRTTPGRPATGSDATSGSTSTAAGDSNTPAGSASPG